MANRLIINSRGGAHTLPIANPAPGARNYLTLQAGPNVVPASTWSAILAAHPNLLTESPHLVDAGDAGTLSPTGSDVVTAQSVARTGRVDPGLIPVPPIT